MNQPISLCGKESKKNKWGMLDTGELMLYQVLKKSGQQKCKLPCLKGVYILFLTSETMFSLRVKQHPSHCLLSISSDSNTHATRELLMSAHLKWFWLIKNQTLDKSINPRISTPRSCSRYKIVTRAPMCDVTLRIKMWAKILKIFLVLLLTQQTPLKNKCYNLYM